MNFEKNFNAFIPELTSVLTIPNSTDWTVKGFIDYYKKIYSISSDTKVVSKIIELMLFPKFMEFATKNNLKLRLSPHQNFYPDITFIDKDKNKYAVDLKSTYKVNSTTVNGMTLGAFTGYFRNRKSTKNVLYPYREYKKHYVFGIIYSRTDISKSETYFASREFKLNVTQRKKLVNYINETIDEKWKEFVDSSKEIDLTDKDRNIINDFIINETQVYSLDNFKTMHSVVRDFDFFIQEKWKIATDRPGSGNTKNIGSDNKIKNLKNGTGIFVREFGTKGKKVFDSYWSNYSTRGMAKELDLSSPHYKNIETYKKWVKSLNS